MLTEVFFDVETKKLFSDIIGFDPADLGISLVSVYRRELDQDLVEAKGQMHSFFIHDLPQMWELFRGTSRVIGFNSKRFDNLVLKPHSPSDFSRLPHFDILEKVRELLGHSLSLNTLSKDTLGRQKSDHGINAVAYWQKEDSESFTKLRTYCEADVLLTRDFYDHILKEKSFKYTDKWNTLREANIDISYPPETLNIFKQVGLF